MKNKYEFDFEEVSVYANIVDLITRRAKSGSTHIDLGCGNAAIASSLQAKGIDYIGFDGDTATIERLKARGLTVYHIDLNDTSLAIAAIQERVIGRQVDSISMIDVIEHLDNAQNFLTQIAAEFGKSSNPILVVSVPNFSHADVSIKFLSGIWEYTDTGLLDRTHRVIYTEENLRKLISAAGWCEVAKRDYRLEQTEQRLLAAPEHYPASGGTDSLIRQLKKSIDTNYNVYQFVRSLEISGPRKDTPRTQDTLTLFVTSNDALDGIAALLGKDGWCASLDGSVQLILSAGLSCKEMNLDPAKVKIKALAAYESVKDAVTGKYFLHFRSQLAWSCDGLANAVRRLNELQPPGAVCLENLVITDGGQIELWRQLARKINSDLLDRSFLPVQYLSHYNESFVQDSESLRAQQLLRVAARAGITFISCGDRKNEGRSLMPETCQLIEKIGVEPVHQLFVLNGHLPEGLISLTMTMDSAVRSIGEMRGSVSWKITAPLRLAGHLARGNFQLASRLLEHALIRLTLRLPQPVRASLKRGLGLALNLAGVLPNSSANSAAIGALVVERCKYTSQPVELDAMCAPASADWPAIDIGVVTYNSQRWIDTFINSLLAIDYPKSRLTVRFVDNDSTDATLSCLRVAVEKLRAVGFAVEVISRPNRGFGAGHNVAIGAARADLCLVTNIDLVFEVDSLKKVVATALADTDLTAAWELRQKPYEHPKFYDPVTGATNWNSHACVLLRRSAFNLVGGYDETLFMYAEDVEYSYRLRRAGYLLRYCPAAVVWHYSYESGAQVKPLQYTGSTFGNLYLRLKYGKPSDIFAVPLMGLRLLAAPEVFPGSRLKALKSLLRLLAVAPKALSARRRTAASFPFRVWDYELIRLGAFFEQQLLPAEQPLVSIITRTYQGRDLYLKQALLSAAHQTWSNLELIVVEDGGDTMKALCAEIASATGRTIHFIANGKYGRSKVGNSGLAAARGKWCVFLDDDDLLFADHVEVLANALMAQPDAVASYTPAWEVMTDASELAHSRYAELDHQLLNVLCQEFDHATLKHHNYFAIQSVLFERRLFIERGGFDEDMDALEDWLLWLRYAKGNRFIYVPKVTSMFRTPADPVNAKKRAEAFDKAYPLALARAEV